VLVCRYLAATDNAASFLTLHCVTLCSIDLLHYGHDLHMYFLVPLTALFTDRVSADSEVDNAIGRVRPFVFALSFEPTDL